MATSKIPVNVEYINGTVTAETGTSSVRANQYGRVVILNGYFVGATVGNNVKLGTISGVEPPKDTIRALCAVSSAAYNPPDAVAYLSITTSGSIYITTASATNKAVYFSVSYNI